MIETERLRLRRPQLDDVDNVLELVGDHEVMRWLGGEAGGRDFARTTVERWLTGWERNGVGHFVVLHDGEVIGRAGLLVWDSRVWDTASYEDAGAHAETELGWALIRRFWGCGYATEAARAVRSWARDERGLARVISLISPENPRSQRVAEKLGALVEQRVELPTGVADVWVHPR
jgi:RimJ/RimL family protein N-acetyltransferase